MPLFHTNALTAVVCSIVVTAGICITKAMNRPLAAFGGRPPGLGQHQIWLSNLPLLTYHLILQKLEWLRSDSLMYKEHITTSKAYLHPGSKNICEEEQKLKYMKCAFSENVFMGYIHHSLAPLQECEDTLPHQTICQQIVWSNLILLQQ